MFIAAELPAAPDANPQLAASQALQSFACGFTPVSLDPFYKSDCQGRFSSLLIAFSSSPLQSALTLHVRMIANAYGWTEQSCVADSSSVPPSIRVETFCMRAGDRREGVDHGSI